MNRAALFFFALGGTMGVGCSSSHEAVAPDGGGAISDAGVAEGGEDSGDAAFKLCNPFFNDLCPPGQTCCFSGLQGVCTPASACHRPFQIECTTEADCQGGRVCCGSGPVANLALTCQSVCPADQFQLCRSDQQCPDGEQCVEVARGFTTMVCAAVQDAGPLAGGSGD
jgi:hypothetical protein